MGVFFFFFLHTGLVCACARACVYICARTRMYIREVSQTGFFGKKPVEIITGKGLGACMGISDSAGFR